MEWETPALSLRLSQARTRKVNMWWHVGSTLCVVGVSRLGFSFAHMVKLVYWIVLVQYVICLTFLCGAKKWFRNYKCTQSFLSYILHFLPPGKNKRVGKQLASQKILQMLHPHVKNWGSLLRMYGRESNKMVKKVRRSVVVETLSLSLVN